MIAISNNHFSHDDQVRDVVKFGLTTAEGRAFDLEFPDWDDYGVDPETCDPEYGSWAADWIESHTSIRWIDGEPYRLEPGDNEDDE